MNKYKIIVVGPKTLLSVLNIKSAEISRNIEDLNDTIKELELMDISRKLPFSHRLYILSSTHGPFIKIEQMLGH